MNENMNEKSPNNHELAYDFTVTVFASREEEQPDGTVVMVPCSEQEVLRVPRLTTRKLLRLQGALRSESIAELSKVAKSDKPDGNLQAEKLLGNFEELLIDTLLPGVLDRLMPNSFNELVARIMEVERETLNPPRKATQKPVAATKSKKK